MRRSLLGSMLLTLALAPSAGAQGEAILLWNECRTQGGAVNQDFDCTTSEGSHSLVVSFTVPDQVTQLVGAVAEMGVSTIPPCHGPGPCDGPVMPSGWQLQAGGCREGSLAASMVFSGPPWSDGTGCLNPWAGRIALAVAVYTHPYNPQYPYGNGDDYARLQVSGDVPNAQAATVDPGNEYYAFHLDLDHALAAGDGACEGCCQPMWVGLSGLRLVTLGGGGDFWLNPFQNYIVSWQGSQAPCGPTPAARPSWGRVKSLYR